MPLVSRVLIKKEISGHKIGPSKCWKKPGWGLVNTQERILQHLLGSSSVFNKLKQKWWWWWLRTRWTMVVVVVGADR